MTGYPWNTGDELFAVDLNAAIANSVALGGGMLPLTGGTMVGPIVLPGNATLPLQAAPLQQVNSVAAASLTYTATGGTTPRTAQNRAADVANVLDFGADPTGATDSAPAINAALATGRAVWMPKGTYLARSAINVGSGARLYGDGRGLTNILVDQGFSSSALGVIVLTGVEDQAPIVEDLRIIFAQPPDTVTATTAASAASATTITVASTAGVAVGNIVQDRTTFAAILPLTTVDSIAGNTITLSQAVVAPGVGNGDSIHFGPSRSNFRTLAAGGTSGPGGTGIMYPPAIYSNGSGRWKLRQLRIDAAWDGIRSPGNSGPGGQPGWISEIEMGALNCGLYVGQSRDFIHIKGYHFWGFGLTAGNPVILNGVYFDGNTVAMDLGGDGGINGANITDCTLQAKLNISGGVSTWAHFTNLMLDGPNSLINMTSGQWIQITNMYSVGNPPIGAAAALGRINVAAGSLFLHNLFTSAYVNPSIVQTGGVVRISGAQLLNGTASVPTIISSGGGDFEARNVTFGLNVAAGPWTTPVVNFTSSGKCTFQSNTFRDASPGDVGGLVIASDSSAHAVSDNAWNGWTWTPPGVAGQYGFNAGVGIIGRKQLFLNALPGHGIAYNMDTQPGQQRSIGVTTNGLNRWAIIINAAAEAGSGVGSDFSIARYSDAGALLSSPISIARSTGHVALNGLPGSPTYANDAAAATGGVGIGELYRSGSGVMVRVS